jgi:hypothetical protein
MTFTTKVSPYDLLMLGGLVLTAIRMAVQYHVLKRVQRALHDAEADVEKLKRKHPTVDPRHQAIYSPGEEPRVNP